MGKIVCIGGLTGIKSKDNVFLPYEPNDIDFEILKLAEKSNPKVLFIGTASKEREDYYESFRIAYESLGCIVDKLEIINNNISDEEIREKILSANIIYVGCGKTRYMLDKWREKGIDKILKMAYDKGIVLAGMSAGSYCWFQYNYELIEGLGLIPMINCVHYEEKTEEQKKEFFKNIKRFKLNGIAIDNDIAIAFTDGEYKIIRKNKESKAYQISFNGNKYVEEEMLI